jgi:hypothetical protein
LLQLTPPQTAIDVRVLLGQSLAELRSGKLRPQLAHAISALAGSFLRAVFVGDLEARVGVLESRRRGVSDGIARPN